MGVKIVLGSYNANYKIVVEGGDQLNFYNGTSPARAYINYGYSGTPGDTLLSRNFFIEANSSGGTTGTVRIKSDGKVGIGITSPEQKLHVEGRGIFDGGGSSDILQIRNDNGGGVFGMTSNLFALDLAATSNFRIRQGSSIPLYLKSNGNLGIGTSSPEGKLHINHSGHALMRITAGDTSIAGIDFGKASDIDDARIRYYNSTRHMEFFVANGERMRIAADGRVGIGTTAPRAKLEVNGELIAQDIKHSNFAVANLNTTGYTIATVTGGGNGSSAQIEFIGMGGTSGIVDVVYSCTNQSGNWYAYKKARQTPTLVDVDVTGHGTTTLSFVFKSLSGTQGYTPRLMMKGAPVALVTF